MDQYSENLVDQINQKWTLKFTEIDQNEWNGRLKDT